MDRPQSPDRSRLSRRTALRWCAIGSLSSLAGCTADVGAEFPPNEKVPLARYLPDVPVEKRTDVLGAKIAALAAEDIADEEDFESALEAADIAVESLKTTYGILQLEFLARAPRDEGLLGEIGSIVGGYAALIDAGHDTTTLKMTIRDRESSTYGAAEATAKDAKRYNVGDLSAKEYGELVASSIESKRDSPDVEGVSDA